MSNKNNIETVAITTRMPVTVVAKMDELCAISGLKRSEYIIGLITADYDKFKGNPELMELLEKFRDLGEKLKQIQK